MDNIFQYKDIIIEHLGHASFKLKTGDTIIYIDPFQLHPDIKHEPADLILITHEHHDHCDPESINKILKSDTIIIAPKLATEKINLPSTHQIIIKLNDTLKEKGVILTAVPAYNLDKFRSPGIPYHPGLDQVGYVININDIKIYHAGDTDNIPEMVNLKNIDIALLPVGGTYTMDTTEALKTVETIKPKITIPMHYNSLTALEKIDIQEFQKSASQFSQIVII